MLRSFSRGTWSRIWLYVQIIVVLALCPTAASAQSGCLGIGCPPNEPPTIRITPFSQTFSTSQITVTIYVADDRSISYSSFHFLVNGVDQSWSLPQTSSTNAVGTFQLTLPSGTSNVWATITDGDGLTATDADTYTNTYTPPLQRDAPTLSALPQPQSFRDMMCETCTNATLSYSTPAYVSLDVLRSVTLTYSSARAYPLGTVQIDATFNVTERPQKVELSLWRQEDNRLQDLTNGANQAQFDGAVWKSRVAAQFDIGTPGGSGSRNFVAEVGGVWDNGSDYRHASIPVRALIIDERNSPYGAGWSIAGLERLIPVADSLLLVDGAGVASFFTRCGANCWNSPPGDYSVLTKDVTNYYRSLRNGTVMTFNGAGYLIKSKNRFNDSTVYVNRPGFSGDSVS
jgi:hypothetical protein